MSVLTKRGLLVTLACPVWSPRRLDDKESRETAKRNGVDRQRAGNYNKLLIDIKAESYVGWKKATQILRDYFYEKTLTWKWQKSTGLIKASASVDFFRGARPLIEAIEKARGFFLSDYPRLVDKAKGELKSMFNSKDYPSVAQLESKFDVRLFAFEIPDGQALSHIEGITEEEAESIREELSKQLKDAEQEAHQELWDRLYKPLKHAAETLSSKDKKFHDTLIGNLREITSLLPMLNFNDDPNLETLRRDIEQKLCVLEPEDLRDSVKLRAKAAAAANDIAAKMAAFMG